MGVGSGVGAGAGVGAGVGATEGLGVAAGDGVDVLDGIGDAVAATCCTTTALVGERVGVDAPGASSLACPIADMINKPSTHTHHFLYQGLRIFKARIETPPIIGSKA